MRRSLLIILAGLALASGCKKQEAPPPPPPKPVPTPAPDLDVLAFTRSGQLWTMKWDGSMQAPLFSRRDASVWFPAASPLGRDFAAWLSKPDGTQNVVRITLDGKVQQLTAIDERASAPMKNMRLGNAPAYDNKGENIAYSFNGNLWIMNRDGENAETLISDGASWSPAFSPDDKRLAYVNGTNGKYDLWIADLESRDTWQVTDFAQHSVGQPRWTAGGKRVMLTRWQKDESDLVQVLVDVDAPLVDADTITTDRMSASGVPDPKDLKVLFSSSRAKPSQWDIWVADSLGKEAKPLTTMGGMSPAWMKAPVEAPVAAAPKPTPPPAPTVAPATGTAQAQPTPAAPQPGTQTAQAAPTAIPPTPTGAKPQQPATSTAQAQPSPIARPTAQPAVTMVPTRVPTATVAKPAPTQPPLKAAALRLKIRVSFDESSDELTPGSLAEIKVNAERVRQYSGEAIQVFGPRDRSPLRGLYPTEEDRSRSRAAKVAAEIAKLAKLDPKLLQSLPFTPTSVGSSAVNGVQISVLLK